VSAIDLLQIGRDLISKKVWRSGSGRPRVGIGKIRQCSKVFSKPLRKILYENLTIIRPIISVTVYSTQKKGDDDESLGATLIIEAERNKLSAKERSWVAAAM
jgi:hypothetical protein